MVFAKNKNAHNIFNDFLWMYLKCEFIICEFFY
jgi:hypothetical protein